MLPRFNFFFLYATTFSPPGYFKEINSIISKFIWNDKCPRIKLTTLQHPNSAGGLAVPNFELYYWSFQLKALHNWVDPQSTVSWRVIEADKVKPNRLQDILFTGTGKKGDNYKFGPVGLLFLLLFVYSMSLYICVHYVNHYVIMYHDYVS